MIRIEFHDNVLYDLLKYAIIISRSQGKWVLCKHKKRDTYEFPAGHKEPGEDILETGKRELYEETGALEYTIEQIGSFTSYDSDDKANSKKGQIYSMLYYAEITKFGKLPDYEMEKIELFQDLPKNLTYPVIQPMLVEIIKTRKNL